MRREIHEDVRLIPTIMMSVVSGSVYDFLAKVYLFVIFKLAKFWIEPSNLTDLIGLFV